MSAKTDRLHAELERVRQANSRGELVADEAIEYARKHPDSELHASLQWDDSEAAVCWRRQQMQQVIRAVFLLRQPDGQSVHAYWSPPSTRPAYVPMSRVMSSKSIALEIARDNLLRIKAAHEDLSVAIDVLPTLKPATRALGRAVVELERLIETAGTAPPPRKPNPPPPRPKEPPPKRRGRPPNQPSV